jgi:transcriptional regulator with XRE-family HTH domain
LKLPRLKEVRELHGWSQAKLAEESDVSRDSISNYETGQREAWPATAKKLADALHVEITDLREPARELATSGKAEASRGAGPPSAIDLAVEAARRQDTADWQTIARAKESGQLQESMVTHENEAFLQLLERPTGELAEGLAIAARRIVWLEQEVTQLTQKLAEHERAFTE